jgi:Spy/CpxP family protein refolding chaperone
MRAVSCVFALAVSLLAVGSLLAAEEKASHEGRHHRPMMDPGAMFPDRMLKGLCLTDEQKAKVETLKKEYTPKLKEAWQKVDGVLTDEQKKARNEVFKTAREANKRGPEVWRDAQAAMKLTDEQKAKMDTARKDMRALGKEAREKVMAVLTPEQQEKVKKEMEEHRQHRPSGNQ